MRPGRTFDDSRQKILGLEPAYEWKVPDAEVSVTWCITQGGVEEAFGALQLRLVVRVAPVDNGLRYAGALLWVASPAAEEAGQDLGTCPRRVDPAVVALEKEIDGALREIDSILNAGRHNHDGQAVDVLGRGAESACREEVGHLYPSQGQPFGNDRIPLRQSRLCLEARGRRQAQCDGGQDDQHPQNGEKREPVFV